jgi:hypothetical protein
MPRSQLSRNAPIYSGSEVQSSSLPSFASRFLTKTYKLGAVLHAAGRVEIDPLHLARPPLLFEERTHHQQ